MKFAICNETFQNWPFDKAFAFARQCGYTGIELAPFTIAKSVYEIPAARRQEIRRQATDAGLEVVGLHWLLAFTEGYYLTTADAAVRRQTSAYFAELTRLCRDVGGQILVLGSPKQRNLLPGVSHEQGIQYAAEVIRGFVPTLEECGVTLAVEPLGPLEGDFLLTADAAVHGIDPTGRFTALPPAPGRQGHVHRAEADCRHHSRHCAWMVHFHANDPNRRGPGMGEVDFLPIFAVLQEINYQGWVSVEVFDYTPGVETLARASIEYMQRCLAQMPAR